MNNNNTPRTPTLVESMLPILAMVLLLGLVMRLSIYHLSH
jgi:NhaC family Na+:H+ antiporter